MQSQRSIVTVMISMFLIFAGSALPNIISKSQAQKTAENFLHYKEITQSGTLKKQTSYRVRKIASLNDPTGNELLAYVVRVHPKGFLIISADPDTDPVIAYSFSQDWYSEMNIENNFYRFLLQDLNSRIKKSNEVPDLDEGKNNESWEGGTYPNEMGDKKFYQWPEDGSTETGGWLETTWTQGTPYNDFCPMDPVDSNRSAVGCIVTAMAQVVHYHKHIGSLSFDDEDLYITATRKIQIDQDSSNLNFPGFNRLNKYLDTIRSKYNDNETLNHEELAALCFACGISIKMDYTRSASSIPWADKGVIHSLKNKMDYQMAESQSEGKKFYDILTNNLINGLPALIYLYNHAIVADGYNTDGFFHLNFGWNCGKPDIITKTWYRPNNLSGEYKKFEYGVLNIQPNRISSYPKITSGDSILYLTCAEINEKSEVKSLTLYNTGETPVTIDDILISKNFYLGFPGTSSHHLLDPSILQPGESMDITIYCLPDTLGRYEGKVQVLASYGGLKKYLSVELIGYGVPDKGTTISSEEISGLWKRSDSPFNICKDVRIPAGKKLQIEPGTEVIFQGSYQFLIDSNAQLIARGTKTDSIYFKALNTEAGWQGFRFISSGSDDTLAYCVVTNANPSSHKAAIYVSSSSLTVTHSTIVKNKPSFFGGAIYLFKSSGMITHSRIKENICTVRSGASAIRLYQSSPVISNVVISKNETKSGGTIYGYKSSPLFVNITLSNNTSVTRGGAFFLDGGNNFIIKNSIIWDNEASLGSTVACGRTSLADTISFKYSDIDTSVSHWLHMDNPSNQNSYILWEEGNFSKDPLFMDPLNNEYTLQQGSPCIDAGDPLDDVGEEPSPNGSRINMGAYGGTVAATITYPVNLSDLPGPSKHQLMQNYPNPFNSKTMINYELPITNYVEINIYNLLGQKVTTIVSERQPAREHQVEWDASGFASGVYLYRIITDTGYMETKKMMLLR
jgi:hypothetical protein